MVFPATPIDVEVSIALSADLSDPGSWSWTDITSYVREGRKIRIRRGRSSERSTVPPSRCTLTVDNTDGRFCRFLPTGAWYGQIGKNTPLRVRVDNGSGYVTRFIGYVAGWPPTWDPSETDQTVELTADGILRRLGQGQVLRSALHRTILADNPAQMWALDDGSDSTRAASALADGVSMSRVGVPTFGASESPPGGSGQAADLTGGGFVATFPAVGTTAYSFELVAKHASAPSPSANLWRLRYTNGGGLTQDAEDIPADGEWHHYLFQEEQVGADLVREIYIDGELFFTFTFVGTSIVSPNGINWNINYASFSAPTYVAYAALHASASIDPEARYRAMLGWAGEQAHERVDRLCTEEGVPVSVTASESSPMGAQGVNTLVALLRECATTDFGLLYEPADAAGLAYLAASERYNLTPAITLDYSAGHIAPPWDPADDDRDYRNDVTATQAGGSSARVTNEDSIAAVGVYDDSIQANTETEEQLSDVAGWAVNLGTVDELRWPAVKPNMLAHPALIDDWMAAELGSQLHVTDHPSPLAPDTIEQIIEGYDETFGSYEYTVVANLSPASGWNVAEWDDADHARFASDGSTLYSSVSSSATTWSVLPNGTRWTTAGADFSPDMKVTVGGEVVEVSAIANATTLVNTASASHGDNASLSPALPASIASGDQLFLFAAIRNTSGTVNTPAGWTSVLELGVDSIALFRKTAGSSESSPTVTFSGGAAGDTTSAVICAFRGVSTTRVTFSSAQSNSSAQNIAYPTLTMLGVDGETDQCLVLLLGWKQDDWTSVAVPAGFTELGEPFTTTGNDQALYWAYATQTHRADVPGGTLTVTGGASAISRARLVAFAGLQTMTISARAVNGVTKAHSSGAEVQVYRPFRFAL